MFGLKAKPIIVTTGLRLFFNSNITFVGGGGAKDSFGGTCGPLKGSKELVAR